MHDSVTIEEFKQAVADFSKEAPGLAERDLECGFSAVAKMYLGVMPATDLNLFTAKTYLEYASRRYFERQSVLQFGHDPLQRLKELVNGLPTGNHDRALNDWMKRNGTADLAKGWKKPIA